MTPDQLLFAAWLLLPAFLANMTATPCGKFLPIGPIDGGRHHSDGRPVLGKGKTWGGLIGGTICGWLLSIAIYKFFPGTGVFQYLSESLTKVEQHLFFLSLAVGALVGDLVESYIKRRRNIGSGEKFVPWDQLDLFIGAVVCGSMVYWALTLSSIRLPSVERLNPWALLALTVLIVPIHRLINLVAFRLKLKSVPH